MIEFPVNIYEVQDTYRTTRDGIEYKYGLRIVLGSPGVFQIAVHPHDRRPGRSRLTNDAIFTLNIDCARFYQPGGLEMGGRTLYLTNGPGQYIYLNEVAPLWLLQAGAEAVKEGIAGGWFPERIDVDGNPVPWEVCEEDGIPLNFHGGQGHATCRVCDTRSPLAFMTTTEFINEDGEADMIAVCNDDMATFVIYDYIDGDRCAVCGVFTHVDFSQHISYMDRLAESVCNDDFDDLYWCDLGNHYIPYDHLHEDFDDLCVRCYEEQYNISRFIQAWNYRPSLQFHPETPTDPLRPLYIGMELEVSWPGFMRENREAAAYWLEHMQDEYSALLYVKHDSSVSDGFEVVTHPMEPQWALKSFPFHVFQEAIDKGARATHRSCGTHIHIDKASLTTAQMWKLMQVHLKLKDFCGLIGERGTGNTYASWDNTSSIKRQLAEIARKKGEAFGAADRYVPFNVQNEHTIELRYLKGDISPEGIRKNIEWVQALYDFTDKISIEDIKQGVLEDDSYLLGWMMDGNYPFLQSFVKTVVRLPRPLPTAARSV